MIESPPFSYIEKITFKSEFIDFKLEIPSLSISILRALSIDESISKDLIDFRIAIINNNSIPGPDNLESTILEYNNPHKTIHRTQKPEKLLEWLIKTYSNEEDTVMDFCMGSGTAGVACKNTNRKFIGVEMDKEIYDLASNRINNVVDI